jgi:hypothetical protein
VNLSQRSQVASHFSFMGSCLFDTRRGNFNFLDSAGFFFVFVRVCIDVLGGCVVAPARRQSCSPTSTQCSGLKFFGGSWCSAGGGRARLTQGGAPAASAVILFKRSEFSIF